MIRKNPVYQVIDIIEKVSRKCKILAKNEEKCNFLHFFCNF